MVLEFAAIPAMLPLVANALAAVKPWIATGQPLFELDAELATLIAAVIARHAAETKQQKEGTPKP
jgi:hypothetical protein